jgi:hypothetical protein
MKRRRVLNFQVALYTIFFMCSSLSQSINVNSKHAVHTNKKHQQQQQLAGTGSSQLAPLPDAHLVSALDDDDDEDDDDKSDDEYINSNEHEFGSSGSSDIIGNPDSEDLDKFQDNGVPFFLKEPENDYIVRKKPAILKCSTKHALKVRTKIPS